MFPSPHSVGQIPAVQQDPNSRHHEKSLGHIITHVAITINGTMILRPTGCLLTQVIDVELNPHGFFSET